MAFTPEHSPQASRNHHSSTPFIRPSASQMVQMNRENSNRNGMNSNLNSGIKQNHFGEPAFFQPNQTVKSKLKIGSENDPYEQVANNVADNVLGNGNASIAVNGVAPVIQKAPDITIPAGPDWDPTKHVAPDFVADRPAPIRSNTKASTTNAGTASLPTTFIGHAAVDKVGSTWRYQLDSIESKGKIAIVYFTKNRYPAPAPSDDAGELTNVAENNWEDIVKDLNDNRTGIPDFWSAYLSEGLHEEYHWKNEWQVLLTQEMVKAEAEIAKLSLGFGEAPSTVEAEAKLKPDVTRIFNAAVSQARSTWMAMSDSPGDPPYIAQAPALDALKDRVNKHAKDKKWDE